MSTSDATGRRPRLFGESVLGDQLRKFFRHTTGVTGLIIVGAFVVISLLAPVLAPYDASRDRDLRSRLQPPSAEHLFGTDELGRDQLIRVWHGGRISLRVGLAAVAMAVVAGSILGLIAGYVGGWIDTIIMWAIDILLAFPGILLAIAIVATLGPSLTLSLIHI